MVDLYQKTSSAVKVGEVYNLNHFHVAWGDESKRRLMGNELVYPPSPKVIEAVKNIAEKANYYPEDATSDQLLRDKLAGYVGLPGKGDWITFGNGSMEIIDMLYRTFINEGDEVIVPTPDYSPYARRLMLYGGKLVDVESDNENFTYSTEDFTKLITPATKMVMVSRPNNPTGFCISEETIIALCEAGVIVVIDEAYVEFADSTAEHLLGSYTNLIISHTFSKAMGLAGFRLGFVIADPEIIGYINRVRTPLNISLITRYAALAAIEDRQYIEDNANMVKRDREYLHAELKKLHGLRPVPSKGNFVLINCRESGIKASEFYTYLFDKGFITRYFVNAKGLPGDEYFRITIGTRQDVENILNDIKVFVNQRQKVSV